MTNKETLKKQILYRATHRGTKEMDLILGNFVKQHIDTLKINDLVDLEKLLLIEDDKLSKWYFEKKSGDAVLNTKVSLMIRNFKL